MSEPIKKPIQENPEGYSPKTPKLANMMEQSGIDIQKLEPQYMIETVFPTGDNPWVGGCNYLRCFISLQMYMDKIPYDKQAGIRYGLYRKYFAVTGMGLSTVWQPEARWENYSFEATHDYIGKTFKFAGYDYNEISCDGKNEEILSKIIADSIYENKPVLAMYNHNSVDNAPSHFNRLWKLFIGYDLADGTVKSNEDGEVKILNDWYENLDKIVLLTKTGLDKPDIKDFFTEVIADLEKPNLDGAPYGYTAYEECITFLEDDKRFETASDEELEQIKNSLGAFFWFHAEARGASGEGYGDLSGQELQGTEYTTDVECNGFWGYNGHQTSYIGCTALRKGAAALREKSHRDILIHSLRMLMSNDAKIIKSIKQAISLDAPDVFSPKDADGQPIDYCFRSKDMMMWASKTLIEDGCVQKTTPLNADLILSRCKAAKVYQVDFKKDIDVSGNIESKIVDDTISVKTGDNIYETQGLIKTKQTFSAPLKIDACIENKDTSFLLSFNNGYMKGGNWGKQPGKILVWDIYVSYVMDFNPEFPAIKTDDINISWILQRDFMAVIVNGELVHYSENFPYTHFDMPNAPVGFGAFDNQTVTVKSLTVSELE